MTCFEKRTSTEQGTSNAFITSQMAFRVLLGTPCRKAEGASGTERNAERMPEIREKGAKGMPEIRERVQTKSETKGTRKEVKRKRKRTRKE